MKLSLCVATRGGDAEVLAFLDRLRTLKPSVPWEVLLVLNRPEPPPAGLLPGDAGLPLHVLHEPVRGKSRALNRAMDAASGDWLVFTDDDIEYPPDWLDRLVRSAGANPWARILGGRILSRGVTPDWIRASSNLQSALLCEHDLGADSRRYPNGLYPFGPNLAVRRDAVSQARARWPEELGPGTKLPVGDEFGFLAQVSGPNQGDRFYVADAVVLHRPQPLYFRPLSALRRAFQVGLAAGKLTARFGPIHGEPALRRAASRLRGLRSLMELACVAVRALGVVIGRYVLPRY